MAHLNGPPKAAILAAGAAAGLPSSLSSAKRSTCSTEGPPGVYAAWAISRGVMKFMRAGAWARARPAAAICGRAYGGSVRRPRTLIAKLDSDSGAGGALQK